MAVVHFWRTWHLRNRYAFILMLNIFCCAGGTAEQLSALHALSSAIVLVIHQNSSCNIVANCYSDSKYAGPFSMLFGAPMFIAKIQQFCCNKCGPFWYHCKLQTTEHQILKSAALLVQKILQDI